MNNQTFKPLPGTPYQERIDEFIHGDIFIFKHTFLNCRNRIGKVCGSRYIESCCCIFCSTMLNRASAFNAALCEHSRKYYRISCLMHALHDVIYMVKKSAVEARSASDVVDAESITRQMNDKKALEELRKTTITL